MTGFEIAGILLGAYPLIGGAVNVYRATKTGSAAATLIRRLNVEGVIYRQFVLNLLASDVPEEDIKTLMSAESADRKGWDDLELRDKLFKRLGEERAVVILGILKEMDKLLRDLNAEFSHINRGIVSNFASGQPCCILKRS